MFALSTRRGVISIGIITAFFVGSVSAQEGRTSINADPAAGSEPIAAPTMDREQAKASVQWLATRALAKMPRTFDGDKDWGQTKKLWAGVKVRLDGLKVKTHRRFREVEQGRWVKYEVTLPRPDTLQPSAVGQLDITVDKVTRVVDPRSGVHRWKIESSVLAPMTFTARVQRWNLGVKLYSATITGRMTVRMESTALIGCYADYAKIPPDLVFDPKIEQARLVLEKFEVDRISHIGGDLAEGWGEILQEVLVERFVKTQSRRLAEKLNKSIDKERNDLRISMSDWLASW